MAHFQIQKNPKKIFDLPINQFLKKDEILYICKQINRFTMTRKRPELNIKLDKDQFI